MVPQCGRGQGHWTLGSAPSQARENEFHILSHQLHVPSAPPPPLAIPFWLLLPTAVSKQIGGRLEDARCLTPKAEREKQRLERVAEDGDKWTCETEGRG